MMRRWWAVLVALAAAVVLAAIAATPPPPLSADAPASAFSAGRAMADVWVIGRAPHPTGSAEDARVRAYLAGRLAGMGLAVRTRAASLHPDSADRLRRWSGQAKAPPGVNVIGVLPGRDPRRPAVLLMAHHDSVWGSPGAADDGAGVASILEVVRALRASPRERDLVVLISDGEELGLDGARSFFERDPLARHVGVIVNMEARGGGGRASMFETGADNGAMMRLFGRAVRRPVSTSLSVVVYRLLPNSTDFTPAKRAGYPGFNFAFIGRPALYHSPLAAPDALDQGALQDMGRQVLDLTRALLAAPTLPGRAADRTFFDAYGLAFVAYPAAVGWVLLGLAAALYAAAAWRKPDWRDGVRGALAMLALVLVSGVFLYFANLVSGADGPVNYYDRLAAIPRLQAQALLLCLAALVLVWALTVQRRRSVESTAAGAALPLFLLAAAVQAAAPTASYPLVWPLLMGGGALALRGVAATIAAVIAAALGVGYMLGFGFFLLQAVGPGMPMVAALPLALSALLLWPLIPEVDRRAALTAVAALMVAAIGIALWVRLDPVAPSVAVYSRFGAPH